MVAEYGLDHRRVGRGAAARQRLVHRSVRYGYRHRRRARATRRYALGRRTRPRTVVRNPSWWTGHRPTAASLDPPWNRRQASIAQPSAERTRLPLCLPGLARPGGMAGDRPLLATPGDLRPRRDGRTSSSGTACARSPTPPGGGSAGGQPQRPRRHRRLSAAGRAGRARAQALVALARALPSDLAPVMAEEALAAAMASAPGRRWEVLLMVVGVLPAVDRGRALRTAVDDLLVSLRHAVDAGGQLEASLGRLSPALSTLPREIRDALVLRIVRELERFARPEVLRALSALSHAPASAQSIAAVIAEVESWWP
jgi:hypothetical protein